MRCLDGGEDLIGPIGGQPLRDPWLPLHKGKVAGVVDDLQVIPQLRDRDLDGAPAIGQGQDAHHLRKVRVRGRADEQPARQAAILRSARPQPRPPTATDAERSEFEHRRLVHPSLLAAFAAHDEFTEVAARPTLVEPQLAPAVVLEIVDEPLPVEVVDVPLRTGAHEPGGYNRAALEPTLRVERLAMDETPRSLAAPAPLLLLHEEPFGEAPGADPRPACPWAVGLNGRRVQSWDRHAGHRLELARQALFDDFVEVACPRPRVEAANDRRVLRQIERATRPPGGDDLAPADLAVCLAAHEASPTSAPPRSLRKRFTSGSTSRIERLTRNFRWCSDSNSVSSISRSSGLGPSSSYLWYCS